MEFTVEHKVIIPTMTPEEEKVFVKFLQTEIRRHEQDIEDATLIIYKIYDK